MRWAQITIEAEPSAVDAVGNCLNDVGCSGFMVREDADPHTVSGYLPVDDRLEGQLDDLTAKLGGLADFGVEGAGTEITLTFVEEDDWANAWKAFYKPMRIGRRLIVTPPWEPSGAGPDDIVIIMDPGMAFGTGSHPTTQLCLRAIDDYVQPGNRVADVGTGSGILAIAAAKLGASVVAGCDIDPLAVDIARKNADVNGVDVTVTEALPTGQFDVVVANILADVIIGMATELIGLLSPSATLIVSGIIDAREGDVSTALQDAGLSRIEVRREGEWVAIILRRGEG